MYNIILPEFRKAMRPLISQSPQVLITRLMRSRDQSVVFDQEIKNFFPIPNILGVLAIVVSHGVNLISLHLSLLLRRELEESPSHIFDSGEQFRCNSMIDHLEKAPILARLPNPRNDVVWSREEVDDGDFFVVEKLMKGFEIRSLVYFLNESGVDLSHGWSMENSG